MYCKIKTAFGTPLVVALSSLLLVGLAMGRIHYRLQTTLIGYDIGHLKADEAKQLETRAYLKMQLEKLTTRKHLQLLTENDQDNNAPKSQRTYALQ